MDRIPILECRSGDRQSDNRQSDTRQSDKSLLIPNRPAIYKMVHFVEGDNGESFHFVLNLTMFTQTRLANAHMALRAEGAIVGGREEVKRTL